MRRPLTWSIAAGAAACHILLLRCKNRAKYYMLFRYAPYLYKFDEGIIKVTNGYDAGVFIEKD